MPGLLYLLFFGSGLSGLVYQVVWVRAFGNVFGNTSYSAAIVVAVFMLGLGVGGYLAGRWADARHQARPGTLLGVYATVELLIAAGGFAVSVALPHLGSVSRWVSSYALSDRGWWVLSPASYLALVLVAVAMLVPVTLLMGGTLTLLVRHLVRHDPRIDGWSIALLYAVNTAGAAAGAFATDFWLVPGIGLLRTQFVAVALNAGVGLAAFGLARRTAGAEAPPDPVPPATAPRRRTSRAAADAVLPAGDAVGRRLVPLTAAALALSGCAAVGLEIVWYRHAAILLGAFRAVFSLLLTVILLGIAAGSLAVAILQRQPWWDRQPGRAARWLIAVQGLLGAATLAGAWRVDVASVDAALAAAERGGGSPGFWVEVWIDAAPILTEAALPALLMGFGFPLANAVVQDAAHAVGRRAGALYLANTVGAVAGSLAAGFLLLPYWGLQRSLLALAVVAMLAAVPLVAVARAVSAGSRGWLAAPATPALVVAVGALLVTGWWSRLPSDAILTRALPPLGAGEIRLALDEGLTEVIEVTDVASRGRRLLTNGHPMSATWPLSQRYMRALAHLPLLAMEAPETALVIGFGVGNSVHAVTLHPSIRRVEVADLSTGVLEHAGYFAESNRDVLRDPRVAVHINDGRHHLLMREPASYDLITLEPPPIGYAGTGALYSREFYALARTRLRPGGYMSQWLPVYQVPGASALAMIRAFVDVFPRAVLVSGAGTDLLLLGTTGETIEVDPDRLEARLRARTVVHADLDRLDLGTVTEIVGTFVGAPSTLSAGTRGVEPVVDDRPVQEYGVRSLAAPDTSGLDAVVDLGRASEWCPRCYRDGRPAGAAEGLDFYLSLLGLAYSAPPADFARVRNLPPGQRVVAGSTYLGAILPETAAMYNLLGVGLAAQGALEPAVQAFRQADRLTPDSPETLWHLGTALGAVGNLAEGRRHLERAIALDPANGSAGHDLGRLLVRQGDLPAAAAALREAARLLPDDADVCNDLGAVLAAQGSLAEAVMQFRRALALRPGDPDATRNLALAGGRAGKP